MSERASEPSVPAWILPALLAAHALLLAWAAAANSVTFDEFNILPGGLWFWKSGAYHNPPLGRLWCAIPAMLLGAEVPPLEAFASLDLNRLHWFYAEAFLKANAARYVELFVAARWMMIPVSCVGAWVVHRWARELYGPRAGLAACALYVLCPNIAAHASLITTDVTLSVAVVAAGWLWWRFTLSPGPRALLLAGAAIALAHLCKYTAVVLWPITAAMALWVTLVERRRGLARLGGWLAALGLTVLALNLTYAIHGAGRPGSAPMSPSADGLGWRALSLLLPHDYVRSIDATVYELHQELPALLFGEVYGGTRWYFYPAALLCKLPLSTWLLIALALASVRWPIAARHRVGLGEAPVLAILLGGFASSLASPYNIGIRHLLPLFPFLFILLGRLWACDPPSAWRRRLPALRSLLLITLAVEHLAIAPRYLTFMNAAAGGPARGYRLLNDSNFDWGQGLVDLKRWMDREGVARIQLGYYGSVDPAVYGIAYAPLLWPGEEERVRVTEERVAISSYYLMGMPHRLTTPKGRTRFFHLAFSPQLRRKRPLAVVGSTIFIYTRHDVQEAMREEVRSRPKGPAPGAAPQLPASPSSDGVL